MLNEVDFKDLRRLIDSLGADRRRMSLEDFAAQVYLVYKQAEQRAISRNERPPTITPRPAPPEKNLKDRFQEKMNERSTR